MSTITLPGGARLSVREAAPPDPAGNPFIFQHGMGGDTTQPLGYLGGQAPVRMVAVDARGHGNSSDAQQGDCRFDAAAADDDDVTLTRGDASTWVCAELARMRHRY